MERLKRKPLQGVTNIIRFNWHYYAMSCVLIIFLLFAKRFMPANMEIVVKLIALLVIFTIIISLIASWYIYDHSNLYSLSWMNILNINAGSYLVNISAGFDETSLIIGGRYPTATLIIFDFYDPSKHTEISIARARKAYPVFPGTKTIDTSHIPLKEESVDYIFLIFAAHEIRSDEERILFFSHLKKVLRINGRIILVEHLRDINNFIAYNIGFFHFLSKKTWKQTIAKADLYEEAAIKITPFISTFILKKNGVTS